MANIADKTGILATGYSRFLYHTQVFMTHPFDRYEAFTDVAELKRFSALPLRKSARVNLLKLSIEEFQAWAKERKWDLEPVPWCPEAFFIDRVDREEALGKDILHLLGHFYLQEAASMLPVALLDPQPGECILDMSAAPGSKTTHIASRMQGQGVIVANDVQEKRLWTLKSNLYRSGVTNAIVMRKVGQWYGKSMTERFDRVLCDAPCTAQGTARKDSDALEYCSAENIGKMAKLQRELLEAAVHAAKVGGRIVYSTCTLTPEENEEVIASILAKFPGQVEFVDPRTLGITSFDSAVEDSFRVQKQLKSTAEQNIPLVRLWPQTYNTEGFFCAVLQKIASTKPVEYMDPVHYREEPLRRTAQAQVAAFFQNRFGSSFIREHEQLMRFGEYLFLTNIACASFPLPVTNYGMGIPYGRDAKDNRFRLEHEVATLRGAEATTSSTELSDSQLADILGGKDTTCPEDLRGDVILRWKKWIIGAGLAKEGNLKNRLPRWLVERKL